MKKADAEKGIRYLCHEWGKEAGVTPDPAAEPNFYAFLRWVRDKYPAYLDFRTSTSVNDDVERWFDQEFKQTWRN